MADRAALQSWAKGIPSTARGPSGEPPPAEGEAGGDVGATLWQAGAAELSPEDAAAVASWLRENEIDLFAAFVAYAEALASGDEAAAGAAAEAAEAADQYLVPEYPELDAAQRDAALAQLAAIVGMAVDSGEPVDAELAAAEALVLSRMSSAPADDGLGDEDMDDDEEGDEPIEGEEDSEAYEAATGVPA